MPLNDGEVIVKLASFDNGICNRYRLISGVHLAPRKIQMDFIGGLFLSIKLLNVFATIYPLMYKVTE